MLSTRHKAVPTASPLVQADVRSLSRPRSANKFGMTVFISLLIVMQQ
jgi:hypothetical protein